MSAYTAGYYNLFGDHEDGCAKRTIEVNDSMLVDLDAEDRIIGVEMLGDNQNWMAALAALAMAGRLTVPRLRPDGEPGPGDPQDGHGGQGDVREAREQHEGNPGVTQAGGGECRDLSLPG